VLAGVGAALVTAQPLAVQQNWDRITATAPCALGILDVFLALTVSHLRAGSSTADLIVSFVLTGIGLVSICILWQRSSNAYFRQLSGPAA
jgi:hypothetical protein